MTYAELAFALSSMSTAALGYACLRLHDRVTHLEVALRSNQSGGAR